MAIFKFDTIKILRIEITTVCNARCGGCSRKLLTNYQHMTPEVWSRVVQEENLKNIEQIYFNGSYGDFSCHPDSISFLNQIPKKDLDIVISTNGSVHSEQYWIDLAKTLSQFRNHKVIFGIDGVNELTHSSYRENTQFSKIINNAKAFISNGGNASWQMVTFKENFHEISAAYEAARNLKFKEFFLINSYAEIKNSQGQKFSPLDSETYSKYFKIYKFKLHSVQGIYYGHSSECPWTSLARVQISVDGSVWPCTWSSETIINRLAVDLSKVISLNNYSLKEIIESTYYQSYITEKVKDKNSYCSTQCPAKYKDVKVLYNIKK